MANQRQSIAERIKGLRDASDLTPEAVASETGVAADESEVADGEQQGDGEHFDGQDDQHEHEAEQPVPARKFEPGEDEGGHAVEQQPQP